MLKIKKLENSTIHLAKVIEQAGVILMATAAMVGLIELPARINSKVVIPGVPVFSMATENSDINNPTRREKEEAGVHYVSYSETQRTQSRTGKR